MRRLAQVPQDISVTLQEAWVPTLSLKLLHRVRQAQPLPLS